MRAFPSSDRYDQDDVGEEDHDAEGHIPCRFSLQAENMIRKYRLPRLTHSVGFEKLTYNCCSNNRLAKNALYTPAGGRAPTCSTVGFRKGLFAPSTCQGEDDEKEKKEKEKKTLPRKKVKTTKPTKATLKKLTAIKRTAGKKAKSASAKKNALAMKKKGVGIFAPKVLSPASA